MKKSLLLFLSIFLFIGTSANAQFLKKLTKKITQKVEEVTTENISDKAAKSADDALNKVWEMNVDSLKLGMGNSIDPSKIPDSYAFDWRYDLSMQMEDGNKIDFIYRLKKDGNYLGIEMPNMANMFMVMDPTREMMVMYMNKMVRATKLDPNLPEDPDNSYSDMEYKKIGSKNILGYNCDGYKSENDDYAFTFYVTDEAGVGYANLYKGQKNLPKGFNPNWIGENSLLMEMHMDNKKDRKKSVTMNCTSIKKENFTISK